LFESKYFNYLPTVKIFRLSYLLFFVYLVLCCWLLTKSRFVKNAELSTGIVAGLFLLKVIAGILLGWAMSKTTYLADTWAFHQDGLIEYHLLFSNPKEYFLNFFQSNYGTTYGGFFQSSHSYWNDLRDNLIGKLLSIFDIFSFGNYYINVVFYNFIIFFGNIGLFRVFNHIYQNKKNILIITCFLLPSLLFYSSEIHREGIVLALIGIIVFNIYYALNDTGFTLQRIIYILLSLSFIFLLRNFIFITILPALAAWIIAHNKKRRAIWAFIIIYTISILVFFNLSSISPRLNLPEKVAEREQSFLSLPKANTSIPINLLQPTFRSFVSNIPEGLDHALLRPCINDIHLAKFLMPFAGEVFLYELILIVFILFYIKNRKEAKSPHPFILFGLFFSLSVFLMIGYTIPVIGAIIRYRAIYFPFILTPLLCNIPLSFGQGNIQIK
jgi:hypothetical protein